MAAGMGVLAAVVAGCQHTPSSRGASSAPSSFEPEGRIVVGGGLQGPSSAFSADRVVGPAINLGVQPDGHWTGWIRDVPVSLVVAGDRLSGPELTLSIREHDDGVEVNGVWTGGVAQGRQISIWVSPKELFVRDPYVRPVIYLEGVGQGRYGTGRYGGAVELQGLAAVPHPPQPQFALALLGAF